MWRYNYEEMRDRDFVNTLYLFANCISGFPLASSSPHTYLHRTTPVHMYQWLRRNN